MNKESDSITSEQEMVADDLSEVLSSSSDDDTVGDDNNIGDIVAAAAAAPSTPVRAGNTISDGNNKKNTTKRVHSIAHTDIENKSIVLFHVDIETGGEHCGIVQLSAVAHDLSTNKTIETFNRFINPGDNAIWDDACTLIHGLSRTHAEIKNGGRLEPAATSSFCSNFQLSTTQLLFILIIS